MFLNSNCTSHDRKIVLFAGRNLQSWKELSFALLSVAWLSRKCLQAPEWSSSSVTETVPVSVITGTGVSVPLTDVGHRMLWDSHGHLSYIYQIPGCDCHLHTAVVFAIFGFSVVCPRGFAFCSFVVWFFSSSGLQFVVRAWRCSACPSGLSTVHICYVVACDGSDKVCVSAFPSSTSVLMLEFWHLF